MKASVKESEKKLLIIVNALICGKISKIFLYAKIKIMSSLPSSHISNFRPREVNYFPAVNILYNIFEVSLGERPGRQKVKKKANGPEKYKILSFLVNFVIGFKAKDVPSFYHNQSEKKENKGDATLQSQ